jgi:hypothetical protein
MFNSYPPNIREWIERTAAIRRCRKKGDGLYETVPQSVPLAVEISAKCWSEWQGSGRI